MTSGAKIALWVGGGVVAAGAAYLLFFRGKASTPPKGAQRPAGVLGTINDIATGVSHAIPQGQAFIGDLEKAGGALGNALGGLFRTGSPNVTPAVVPEYNGYVDAGLNDEGIPNAIALPEEVDAGSVDTADVGSMGNFDDIVSGSGEFASF